jgi:hypothetical protein
MKRAVLFICSGLIGLLCVTSGTYAQGASDIFLVKMSITGDKLSFDEPAQITRQKGYNNQPYFVPGTSFILFSSEMEEGKQTDISRYDMKTKNTSRLTFTPESEYSPAPMPGENKFSVIRLFITEGPRKDAQPLMAISYEGGSEELLYEDGKKVGYHTWIDKNRVALFILGEPNTLQIVDLKSKKSLIVAKDIGRCLIKIPGQNAVLFTDYEGNKQGVIKSADVDFLKITPIVSMKEGTEDFTWAPGGALLMGVESRLYRYVIGKDKDWVQVADFTSKGIKKISRLAVDPTGQWLALVSN